MLKCTSANTSPRNVLLIEFHISTRESRLGGTGECTEKSNANGVRSELCEEFLMNKRTKYASWQRCSFRATIRSSAEASRSLGMGTRTNWPTNSERGLTTVASWGKLHGSRGRRGVS